MYITREVGISDLSNGKYYTLLRKSSSNNKRRDNSVYACSFIITHILRGHQINHDNIVIHELLVINIRGKYCHQGVTTSPPFNNQNRLSAHYVIMQISRRRHK